MKAHRLLWRAFEANEITHSGAHYLLAVAVLARAGRPPRAADVARQLGVSRAAASLQLRALQEHDLVELDDQQRLHLTGAGVDLVVRVAGKRDVVTVFLRDILGLSPATAELDACKIEHLLSEETGAAFIRLIHFLRSPDPVARACITAFRQTIANCPPRGRCDLCTQLCLLAAGRPA